jgi:enamine deaminase RidA (YjgF/YER057c/UK114 family)
VDWLKDSVAPSRATIQADLVNPKWLIEIAVIAAQK